MATSVSKQSFSLHVLLLLLLHSYCIKMDEKLLWPFVTQTWLHREKEGLPQL
jgi:hypothetical protein